MPRRQPPTAQPRQARDALVAATTPPPTHGQPRARLSGSPNPGKSAPRMSARLAGRRSPPAGAAPTPARPSRSIPGTVPSTPPPGLPPRQNDASARTGGLNYTPDSRLVDAAAQPITVAITSSVSHTMVTADAVASAPRSDDGAVLPVTDGAKPEAAHVQRMLPSQDVLSTSPRSLAAGPANKSRSGRASLISTSCLLEPR